MSVVKGQNFRVFIAGKVVACATSCSLHMSADLEETSSKDDTGSWKSQEAVSKSWDGSVDALAVLSEGSGSSVTAYGYDSFLDLLGTSVAVTFYATSGDKNRTQGDLQYSGNAIINDISQTWANKQNGTYTVQFTGTGELEAGEQ